LCKEYGISVTFNRNQTVDKKKICDSCKWNPLARSQLPRCIATDDVARSAVFSPVSSALIWHCTP